MEKKNFKERYRPKIHTNNKMISQEKNKGNWSVQKSWAYKMEAKELVIFIFLLSVYAAVLSMVTSRTEKLSTAYPI